MISAEFLFVQALNGVQLGILLFLMAAGLTLVFGIMNLVNLAQGSLYMLGAYFAASFQAWTGSFLAAALLTIPATMLAGIALEMVALRTLYNRDHLDQVLATFGLILFFNELVRIIWGPSALFMTVPPSLDEQVTLFGDVTYPAFRLLIIVTGLVIAGLLAWLVNYTRLGMLIRAGASNRAMVSALGVDIGLLYTLVFGLGAGLAGLAGLMAGPLLSVESGMGEPVLILTFVVIVIGGIGSIRGAFVAALMVGVVDTIGRSFLPMTLRMVLPPSFASAVGPALASMAIYILMAAILAVRPQGLFSVRG